MGLYSGDNMKTIKLTTNILCLTNIRPGKHSFGLDYTSSGTFTNCVGEKVNSVNLNDLIDIQLGEYSEPIPPHLSPTGDWLMHGKIYNKDENNNWAEKDK